jgi:hypothetical protein
LISKTQLGCLGCRYILSILIINVKYEHFLFSP